MLSLFFIVALAQFQKDPSVLTLPVAQAASIEYSTTTLEAFAFEVATRKKINPEHFVKTLDCESHFDAYAVGDQGTSIGVAQLHYPSRDWKISTSTAFNPYVSIEIAADAWANGEASRWSCYTLLYGSGKT